MSMTPPALADSPTVTVILTTCERLEYLGEAIESVLAQTYTRFQLMVCDDASLVDVPSFMARYDDPRITYLRNPVRLGPGGNNHAAYSRADGELIAHIDDDDLWAPTFLESMVRLLQGDPGAVLAFSDKYVIDGGGRPDLRASEAWSKRWGRWRLRPGRHQPFYELAVLSRSIPVAQAAVVRRDALQLTPFPRIGWDWWIAYLVCRTGGAALFDPHRLAYYRIHSSQVSTPTAPLALHQELVECYETVTADPVLASIRPALASRLADTRARAAVASLREGLDGAGRQLAWRATRGGPITWRVVVARALTLLPHRVSAPVMTAVLWGFARWSPPILPS